MPKGFKMPITAKMNAITKIWCNTNFLKKLQLIFSTVLQDQTWENEMCHFYHWTFSGSLFSINNNLSVKITTSIGVCTIHRAKTFCHIFCIFLLIALNLFCRAAVLALEANDFLCFWSFADMLNFPLLLCPHFFVKTVTKAFN